MRPKIQLTAAGVVMLGLLLTSACHSGSDNNAQAASNGEPAGWLGKLTHSEKPITIPEQTPIEVRLVDTVGSARNRSGNVTGRVVAARPSGHLETPAELSVTLSSLESGGKSYEIATSTHSWRGASHKKHDAKWIAGGAGAGALIGLLAGHGKGAAIGAGVGAGAGTAGAYATGKKDITLGSETRLRFVLRRPLTVAKAG